MTSATKKTTKTIAALKDAKVLVSMPGSAVNEAQVQQIKMPDGELKTFVQVIAGETNRNHAGAVAAALIDHSVSFSFNGIDVFEIDSV